MLLALKGLTSMAAAQTPPPGEPPFSPILLASKLGEMCSQCTAALACTPAPEGGAPATIYLFPVKTFWQQILTIPTYLPFIGKPETDRRPVIVHAPATAETGTLGEAALDFGKALVRVPGAAIDRGSGAWRDPAGAVLGRCRPAGRTLAEARRTLSEISP